MTPVLVFDIETVPDVAGIRRLSGLPPELDDAAVRDWFAQQRRAATGGDFAPHRKLGREKLGGQHPFFGTRGGDAALVTLEQRNRESGAQGVADEKIRSAFGAESLREITSRGRMSRSP